MSEGKPFSILRTGLRSGEFVEGIQSSDKGKKGNRGTIMQVDFGEDYLFRPYSGFYVPNDLNIRDGLNFGFFGNMTYGERDLWIKENFTNSKNYISDFSGKLRFLSIGGEFTKLSSEDQKRLMSGEWISIRDVFDMFPKKPGSKAANHTLIFRGSIWSLVNQDVKPDIDFYFDLIDCNFSEIQTRSRVCIVKIERFTIGVCDEEQGDDYPESEEIKSQLVWFTPGILKSCIQKCIRMYPIDVQINDLLYPVEDVLITTFVMLLKHPGSFVPDLNTFVKGSESAMKRLAVSIIEDSSSTQEVITSLFLAALAARSNFVFSNEYVYKCCEWASNSLNPNCFVYDWHNLKGREQAFEDFVVCKTLEVLKSFESDINMLKSICENNWITESSIKVRPKVMPTEHCFDQHCTTAVIHLYNVKDSYPEPESVVKLFWDESSKFNPRKHNFKLNKQVKLAQKRFWKIKTNTRHFVEAKGEPIVFSKELSESWISGMIGPMENKVSGINTLSFFHPENISSIVTIRAPSRVKDERELTDEEMAYCAELVANKKRTTFHLKELSIGIDHDFVFTNDAFYISTEKGRIPWVEFCNEEISINVLPKQEMLTFDTLIDLITTRISDGVVEKWEEKLFGYISKMRNEVIFRLGMYIRVISNKISLYKISRDGTGTYLSVNWTDSYVFRFLCYCCALMPGVIQIDFSNNKSYESLDISFKINNMFFWNHVRNIVFSQFTQELYDWGVEFKDDRTPKDHQIEAVESIMDRIKFGKRGNIVFISVGGGKTLITILTLFEMMRRGCLPKYVVYSLPPSAYESVLAEFSRSGLPTTLLDSTIQGKKHGKNKLKEFHVNFIKQDHLREDDMRAHLVENSLDTFLILDEFHLVMNTGTQRTSVALELSKICNNFIAMTGTLIKNSDATGIIEWVSQVVDFELTTKNYMVGVATLISRKINLGIEERRIFVDVPMNREEYYSYVDSKLGGTAERVDFRKAVNICYEVTQDAIFDETLKYLNGFSTEDGTFIPPEDHIFVIALSSKMQDYLSERFESNGIKCFKVTSKTSINMTPETKTNYRDIRIVIATMSHSTGYNLTACKTLIWGVYFSNQATRTQMCARVARMGQQSPYVNIVTIHTGILSHTLAYYEDARSLERALSDLAKSI